MKKNNLKIKIYKAIFYALLMVAIVVIGMIIYKYICESVNEYKIIGIVKIPKINIEYPILDIGDIDPESAKSPMKISIIKYWGENVNDYGNLSIAGHNNKSGTMFGKTKNLTNGDIVELTDLKGQTIQYSIYSIFVTDPNDVSILLPKEEKIREVTLITCTNGNKQRLILKAKEI